MSNRWFRLYAEFASDAKVQMMSEAMQRRLLMLMCLRCSNELVTLHETEIAFALRISDEELKETHKLFIAKGFLDKDWNVLNWEKRQISSDSSTERVRKHREKIKEQCNGDETFRETNSNALEQNRTEQNRTEDKEIPARTRVVVTDAFEGFWNSYPPERRIDKKKCFAKWKSRKLETIADQITAHVVAMKNTQQWRDGIVPNALTYINQSRWETSVPVEKQLQVAPKSTMWWESYTGIEKKAGELGLQSRAGETYEQFKARISNEIEKRSVAA